MLDGRMRKLTAAAPLVLAAGLIAMLLGHALQLALENAGAFADWRAAYAHAGQLPALLFAGALLATVVLVTALRLLAAARGLCFEPGALVPALHTLKSLRLTSLCAGVICVQFSALIAVELLEQHLSAFDGAGLSAIFGSGHATAAALHLLIGLLGGLGLRAVVRHACSHAPELLRLACAALAFFKQAVETASCGLLRALALLADCAVPRPMARGMANRPPPHFILAY
jgi:hypothetical protein